METKIRKPDGKDSGLFANTFHWELNLYSFSLLTLVYYITPAPYLFIIKTLFALIAIDAARYYYKKGSMAGVPYTLPLVTVIAMIVHPVRFWAEMANIAMASEDGMCTNTLVGCFLVFVTDPQVCRDILSGEGTYGIYAHPNALWLFGKGNLIYMNTEQHKAFRKVLTPALFSTPALHLYAKSQTMVVRKFLTKYLNQCQQNKDATVDLRIAFRSMAAAASQKAFLGPYLDDNLREHLEEDILIFTLGFLCFPFPYLNTGLFKAVQAKHRIEKTVRAIVPKAKKWIFDGNKPRCMIEFWCESIINTAKEQGLSDVQMVHGCTDDDIAMTVLDFLFAAQDATNSALTYAADILDARPDVWQRMREEAVETFGDNAEDSWTKIQEPSELKYIHNVANQMLHYRPPVPMIPHLSKKPSILGGHPVGAGVITIPSIAYSARVAGFADGFDPDDPKDPQFLKCYTFGGGQHKCPGRRYAESLLSVFLTVVATEQYQFERVGPRPGEDDFIYFPTLFPAKNDFKVTKKQ